MAEKPPTSFPPEDPFDDVNDQPIPNVGADDGEDLGVEELVQRLTRELRKQARAMSTLEARYLVSSYYSVQRVRIEAGNRVASVERGGITAVPVAEYLKRQLKALETRIASLLGAYSQGQDAGRWALAVKGIGPVLSAGLLAYFDPKVPYAGNFWNYAGLNPGVSWLGREKAGELLAAVTGRKTGDVSLSDFCDAIVRMGRKPDLVLQQFVDDDGEPLTMTWDNCRDALARRPWNANAKLLCWKVGESFVKVSGDDAYYRLAYEMFRAEEERRNAAGELADEAARVLREKRIGTGTKARQCYDEGQLPPAHIYARAKRKTVKLFLSHFHHVYHESVTGKTPEAPYAIAHLEHGHYVAPPNWPI